MGELDAESEDDFKNLLRIEPAIFRELLERVGPQNDEAKHKLQKGTGTWSEAGHNPETPRNWRNLP